MLLNRIEAADIQARKTYLDSVISEIRARDHKIQIIGDKASLAALIAGQQTVAGKVSGFVRKWCAMRNRDYNSYLIEMLM